jgi:hypothetical protein
VFEIVFFSLLVVRSYVPNKNMKSENNFKEKSVITDEKKEKKAFMNDAKKCE